MQDTALIPVSEKKELSARAICFYQGASLLYQRGLYRWPLEDRLLRISPAAVAASRAGLEK